MSFGTRVKIAFGKNPSRFCIDMLFVILVIANLALFASTVLSWKWFLLVLAIAVLYVKVIRPTIGWQ